MGCEWFNVLEDDVIQDRKTKEVLHLSDEGPHGKSILVIKTSKISSMPNKTQVKTIADNILKRNQSALLSSLEVDGENELPVLQDKERIMMSKLTSKDPFEISVMAFNVAKLTEEERSRLYVRRFGYCNSQLLTRMTRDSDFGKLPKFCALYEDNPVKDAAKFKKLSHGRTDPELSMGRLPWMCTYVDGYGGGRSMGAESYEGAIPFCLLVDGRSPS